MPLCPEGTRFQLASAFSCGPLGLRRLAPGRTLQVPGHSPSAQPDFVRFAPASHPWLRPWLTPWPPPRPGAPLPLCSSGHAASLVRPRPSAWSRQSVSLHSGVTLLSKGRYGVSGSLGCRPRSGAPPDPRRAPDHSASGTRRSMVRLRLMPLQTVLSRSDEVSLGPVRWFLSLKPFCVETLCSRGCRASQDLGQLEVLTSCRWHILACGFAPGVSHPATQSASRPPGCGCILDAAFATPRPPPLRLEHSTVLMSLDVTTSLPHGRVASRDHISVWR